MAASLVAGPADCVPLPSSPHRSDPSLSPLPPNPPPPPTREQKSPSAYILPNLKSPTRISEGGHEQNSPAKAPDESQRPPDYLPPEMLLTLKQQHSKKVSFNSEVAVCEGSTLTSKEAQLSPKKDTKELPSVRPPANLWSYPRRRSRFTHLTAHPPCVCGAGRSATPTLDLSISHSVHLSLCSFSRDISFLYDVPEDHRSPGQVW